MGEQKVSTISDRESRILFIRHLLNDIKSLEYMLEHKLIEDDIIRIGSEQEFCLVTDQWRPALNSPEVLEEVNDPHFTTELARYNLEINLDPEVLEGSCFSVMESKLRDFLNMGREAALKHGSHVVLTGILPSVTRNELDFEYMTPLPRYKALNDKIKDLRGTDFELHIRGVEELSVIHDSVLFEACNTSFQMHLQIAPDDFVASYNWSQAIAGPVLAISTNSPLLLGKELWSETRIALFQQSIDTRKSSYAIKEQQPRVTFGDDWVRESVTEIFRHDIAQFRVILTKEIENNSLDQIKNGIVPKLEALSLHNGTVYRWNRPCYGVGGGKPHLRIENRYVPSGPTVIDEMANFAFWVGLMRGRPEKFSDLPNTMDFRDAKSNFIKAARYGKECMLHWEGECYTPRDLVINELLPIARKGLEKCNIDPEDIDRYLDVIEARAKGHTGSQWTINNYRRFRKKVKKDDALLAMTKAMHDNQFKHIPVHEWPAQLPDDELHEAASTVEHIMQTQLFTVNENDLAELATDIMSWMKIHHVPVENNKGDLCGILTWTHMQRFREIGIASENLPVKDIMVTAVLTIQPKTTIQEAIRVMKKHEIGCLPVVDHQKLVGIITVKDVLPFNHD